MEASPPSWALKMEEVCGSTVFQAGKQPVRGVGRAAGSVGPDGVIGPAAGSSGSTIMPTGPCQGQPFWAGMPLWLGPVLGALGWGGLARGSGRDWGSDFCFHLISSVVFQELWQDPEGRGGGGEATGRRPGLAACPPCDSPA